MPIRWKRQGWRNRRGLPLKYQGLWQELLAVDRELDMRWTWVRGHSEHKLQIRADALAYSRFSTYVFLVLLRNCEKHIGDNAPPVDQEEIVGAEPSSQNVSLPQDTQQTQ